jgi:hypothetical protein
MTLSPMNEMMTAVVSSQALAGGLVASPPRAGLEAVRIPQDTIVLVVMPMLRVGRKAKGRNGHEAGSTAKKKTPLASSSLFAHLGSGHPCFWIFVRCGANAAPDFQSYRQAALRERRP